MSAPDAGEIVEIGASTSDDTDRPAAPRGLAPDPSPESPILARVYQPGTPWALFARLGAVYVACTAVSAAAVVGGWWVAIGPTDDTPPAPVVKVERIEVPVEVQVPVEVPVEVPVPAPAPEPKVVYVQVPAPPATTAPKAAPSKPREVAPPPAPEVAPSLVATAPPVAPVAAGPVPDVVKALDGSYSGKAGADPAIFDLEFLSGGKVKAKITVQENGQVLANAITGTWEATASGATVALFVGDIAYTGVVSGRTFTGRVSQGEKNLGKLNVRR